MSDLDYPREARTTPAVTYGLYILGLSHGLTILIALVIAYASRGGAGPVMRSHYTWIIRTFWISIAWLLIGGAMAFWGGLLSIILVGLPFLWLGLTICGLVWVWTLVRLIAGCLSLANDQPYPRPRSWLL